MPGLINLCLFTFTLGLVVGCLATDTTGILFGILWLTVMLATWLNRWQRTGVRPDLLHMVFADPEDYE